MARVLGIEYPALIRNICELGLSRARESAPVDDWALAQRLSGVELAPSEPDLFTSHAAGQD
jgi:hypothetical protein